MNTDVPKRRGSAPKGLVYYLLGPGRKEEHVDPRLIGTWEGRLGKYGDMSPAELGAVLKSPVDFVDPEMKKFVYHLRIRNHESDPVLSDQQWNQVASDAMHGTGISRRDDPGGCRWLAFRHDDNHIHVVATLVRQDGSRFYPRDDWVKLGKVRNRAEERFGLRVTSPAERTADADLSRAELEKATRKMRLRDGRDPDLGGGVAKSCGDATARTKLRKTVRVARDRSSSLSEFVSNVEGAGVVCGFRFEPGYEPLNSHEIDLNRVTGWRVSWPFDDSANGRPLVFKGGSLGKDLTWPKIGRYFEGRRLPSSDAASGHSGLDYADEAVRVSERVRAELSESDQNIFDSDFANGVSRFISRTAFEIEGSAGGPLTDLADRSARSAAEPFGRQPNSSSVGLNALFLSMGGKDKQTKLLLTILMLMETTRQLKAAQGQQHQALLLEESRLEVIEKYGLNLRLRTDPETTVRQLRVQPGLDALGPDGDAVRVIGFEGSVATVERGEVRCEVDERKLRPNRFVSQSFVEGARVRTEDRGNIGTVTDIKGDEVSVFFKNPKTEKTAKKTFARKDLEVISSPRTVPKRPMERNPKQRRKDQEHRPELEQDL